jgi:hypothetical protein
MKLSLLAKKDSIKNDFWVDELSSKSFGIYISWSEIDFATEKFYWRIVGLNNEYLLSFDITGGMICALESMIAPDPVIINNNYSYDIESNIKGIPVFGLIPNTNAKFILHENGFIDVKNDFIYEKYINCSRFTWGVCSFYFKINEYISVEFSSDFSFVGFSIFEKSK